MTKVRWGLVSTANINRRLIPAIRASERGELVAVASRTQESADAYAAKWGIGKTFGSYQAMLESGKVDAVYISLPNHLHAEWSIKAMERGIHVLCEKPFALTLDQVDRMISTSQNTGHVIAEAFMYRHHPQTKIVGEWLAAGNLGDVISVNGAFNYKMEGRDDVRLVPEYGGGSLWDVGVYPLSLAQFIFGGPPDWVSGTQWLGDTGVDEDFGGLLHYDRDRFANIRGSFRSPFYTFVEIQGTKGRLELTKPFVGIEEGGQVTFFPEEGQPQILEIPEKELYLGEVEDMNNAILDGTQNYITLAETRNHIKTVLALLQSAKENKLVILK